MDIQAIDLYLQKLQEGVTLHNTVHDADMADYLEAVKHQDVKKFFTYLDSLPLKLKADTLMELPVPFQIDFILAHDADNLAQIIEVMQSDDGADFVQVIHKTDPKKAEELLKRLNNQTQETIETLMHYQNNEAGSLMQTELFQVSNQKRVADAILALRILKQKNIGSVHNLYVTDETGKFINTIELDDLLLEEKEAFLDDIIKKLPTPHSVTEHDAIEKALETIEKYDIASLAVVDAKGMLLGRITHDDALDVTQKRATQQMYNLNKVSQSEELHESFGKTTQTRTLWLSINLFNAIIASLVIGIFEETLTAVIALAVLMPIVANMAGTASVQTMTVTVRQMALGQISFHRLKPVFVKEITMAVINGIWFGIISAIVAQIWFEQTPIAVSIGLSMFVSFLFAGILGTSVPLLIKKAGFDPAVASSVIVITLIDIIGFFSFLSFAEIIVL